jgi:hypothetical protein
MACPRAITRSLSTIVSALANDLHVSKLVLLQPTPSLILMALRRWLWRQLHGLEARTLSWVSRTSSSAPFASCSELFSSSFTYKLGRSEWSGAHFGFFASLYELRLTFQQLIFLVCWGFNFIYFALLRF